MQAPRAQARGACVYPVPRFCPPGQIAALAYSLPRDTGPSTAASKPSVRAARLCVLPTRRIFRGSRFVCPSTLDPYTVRCRHPRGVVGFRCRPTSGPHGPALHGSHIGIHTQAPHGACPASAGSPSGSRASARLRIPHGVRQCARIATRGLRISRRLRHGERMRSKHMPPRRFGAAVAWTVWCLHSSWCQSLRPGSQARMARQAVQALPHFPQPRGTSDGQEAAPRDDPAPR